MASVPPERVDALIAGFGAVLDADAPMPALTRDEAAAIADGFHADLDRQVAARDREIVARGHALACARGCAACCETILIGTEDESAAIARWLVHPDRAKKKARFLARHRRWRADHGEVVDRAAAASEAADRPALRTAAHDAQARHAMCPFNHQGVCEIYPVRPNVCRDAHALDTAAGCVLGGSHQALAFVPITELLARIRPIQELIQAALPDAPLHRGPVADRVAALIAV